MKPMIWHPEEKDEKQNQYLERANHAPYVMIWVMIFGWITVFSLLVLLGNF